MSKIYYNWISKPKKGLKIWPALKISKLKSLFKKKYFSEMNLTHPFYPIMIPNSSYPRKNTSQGVQENIILMISKNYFR